MTAISTESPNIKRLADLPASAMRKLTPEEIAHWKERIAPPVPAPPALKPEQWTPRPAHYAHGATAAALVHAQQIRDEAWAR